jgi:hypothetical protein
VTELDEAEIEAWNGKTPPSYWSIDIEERDPAQKRHPWLMGLHVLFMSLAYFCVLPVGKRWVQYHRSSWIPMYACIRRY